MANALTPKLDLRFEVKSKRATFQMQLNLLDYLSKSQRQCLLKRKILLSPKENPVARCLYATGLPQKKGRSL